MTFEELEEVTNRLMSLTEGQEHSMKMDRNLLDTIIEMRDILVLFDTRMTRLETAVFGAHPLP